MKLNLYIMFMSNEGKWKSIISAICIQVHNPLLLINLYIMVVNNEYNSHIVFDEKIERCTTFKVKVLSHTLILMSFCYFIFNNIHHTSDSYTI